MQYRNPIEEPRPAEAREINIDAVPGGVTGQGGPGRIEPWWRPGTPTEFASDGPIDCWTDDPDDDIDVEILPTAGS